MPPALILTHRGIRQQQYLLAAIPPELDLQVTILRDASQEEILSHIPQAEFLISEREDVINAAIIAAAPKLRLIQRLGSQTYDIDLAAARSAGIPVCFWPDLGAIAVAEHCAMQTLALLKKVREMGSVIRTAAWDHPSRLSDEDTFDYNWSQRRGVGQLWGKTAGILGFGEIGRELAGLLRAFKTRVLYHKRNRMSGQAERELAITYASPAELLRQADIVYGLLPFRPEAPQSLNAALFASLKPGSYFIFCGGSGMLNEDDLLAALRSGHLAGAALDTYTREPLPADSPLLAYYRESPSANLILTPHVAAGTGPFSRKNDYTNLLNLLTAQPLQYQAA